MITSPANERVKRVRLLQTQAKARRKQGRLVLEGVRLVGDALRAGLEPDYLLVTDPAPSLIGDLAARGVPCLTVSETLMRAMSDTEAPQGIIGVFPWPRLPIPPAPDLVLVADGWRDPGNLGTAIRTGAAAGVDVIVLPPGTVDPFNPKTLRAGMGGHFRVPLVQLDWPQIVATFDGLALVVADTVGATPYDQLDWKRPIMLVVGGEAHGLGDAVREWPHESVSIPMANDTESLNAAMAAGILMFEARRQRQS